MSKTIEEPENTGEILENEVVRDENGRIVSGSLNPNGKPKGSKHMSTLLEEAIKAVAEDGGTTEDKEIVRALIKKAKAGDTKAIDMVFDRLEGKPGQAITLDTSNYQKSVDPTNADLLEAIKQINEKRANG